MKGNWKAPRREGKRTAHFFPEGHWWSLCTQVKQHEGVIVDRDGENIIACPDCERLLKREEM